MVTADGAVRKLEVLVTQDARAHDELGVQVGRQTKVDRGRDKQAVGRDHLVEDGLHIVLRGRHAVDEAAIFGLAADVAIATRLYVEVAQVDDFMLDLARISFAQSLE